MVVGEIYSQKLNPNDPHLPVMKMINDNANYIHDQTRQDKARMMGIGGYCISLFLTALFSLFVNLIALLLLANVLMGILIIFARDYKKRRKRFWENRKVVKKDFKSWGMEWRD